MIFKYGEFLKLVRIYYCVNVRVIGLLENIIFKQFVYENRGLKNRLTFGMDNCVKGTI